MSAEPAIKMDCGVRRHDVVVYKPGEAAVIVDVAVVCDILGSLQDGYTRKCRKYEAAGSCLGCRKGRSEYGFRQGIRRHLQLARRTLFAECRGHEGARHSDADAGSNVPARF